MAATRQHFAGFFQETMVLYIIMIRYMYIYSYIYNIEVYIYRYIYRGIYIYLFISHFNWIIVPTDIFRRVCVHFLQGFLPRHWRWKPLRHQQQQQQGIQPGGCGQGPESGAKDMERWRWKQVPLLYEVFK